MSSDNFKLYLLIPQKDFDGFKEAISLRNQVQLTKSEIPVVEAGPDNALSAALISQLLKQAEIIQKESAYQQQPRVIEVPTLIAENEKIQSPIVETVSLPNVIKGESASPQSGSGKKTRKRRSVAPVWFDF